MSVGEALAEARIRAGLTIEEVSARSLIRQTVITAMERDDYEACGGSMYINGYIRAVAAAIGIDPRPMIAAYAEASHQAQSAGAAPATEPAPAPEPPSAPEPPPSPEPVPASERVPDPEPEPEPEPAFAPEPLPDLERAPAEEYTPESELPLIPGFAAEPEPEPEPHIDAEADAEPVPNPGAVADFEDLPDLGPIVQPVSPPEAEVTLVDMFLPLTDSEPEPPSPQPTSPPQPTLREPTLRQPSPQQRPARTERRTYPEETRPGRTRERRRLGVVAASSVVVLVVVALAITELVTHASHSQNTVASAARATAKATPAATSPTTPSPSAAPTTPTASAAPAVTTLTPAGAEAFGPGGPADGDNASTASRAIDGSATTAWESDWYATANFGGDKAATGLLIDMGRVVNLDDVTIQLESTSGANLEIKTGTTTDALATRDTAANAAGTVTLKVTGQARYILLWFTQLAPVGNGTYQVSVYNITVKGNKI